MIIGIVGKPNTGKSTFFSAATLIPVPIDNRPFTTIQPNKGIAYVKCKCICKELQVKDQPRNSLCIDGTRFIPVELVDCAGLVPNSWQGKGLGNYFLDEVRKADALIHVVDAAGATDGEGKICKFGMRDPLKDVEFLEREITMWIGQILMKDWKRIVQNIKLARRSLINSLYDKLSGLAITTFSITEALRITGLNPDKPNSWTNEDLLNFVDELRKISKPMIIAANKIDLLKSEEVILRLKERGYIVVPCCTEAELILRRAAQKGLISYKPGDSYFNIKNENKLNSEQKKALNFVKEKILEKWNSTGIQEAINKAVFDLLRMIIVYPVENVEKFCDHNGFVLPDAYVVPYGTTTKQLAFLIHSDLGNSFIYATDARTKRRLGEEYVLNNGDIIKFVSAKSRT